MPDTRAADTLIRHVGVNRSGGIVMSLYERILCPIDGSVTSERGMREAAKIAKALGSHVRFFHAVDLQPAMLAGEGAVIVPGALEAMRERGEQIIDSAKQFAREQGLNADVGMSEAVGQRAADAIIDEASRSKADLIVVGSHGRRGVRRMLLGSDAEMITRQSPCAVLIVH
jgi:nucleotide-binding universal stress UspA family protein